MSRVYRTMAYRYVFLFLTIVVLFAACLVTGSVHIPISDVAAILLGEESVRPAWHFIVIETRLPQALTALLAGGSLASSGLMLQTAFRNPLAAPDVFGITSGASLMVAIVTLGTGVAALPPFLQHVTTVAAAFVGAMAVTLVIWLCSRVVRSSLLLIIIGIMVGYLASSAITVLNFFASVEGVKSYAVWGMGDFGNVSLDQMPFFATICILATLATLLLMKPLNALLLGERYAENMGISFRTTRNVLMLLTGLLTAVVTAYCGPVAFIALAVPHVASMMVRTNNHRQLLPMTILTGAAVALLCNLFTTLPGDGGMLPLNAVTPFVGAPVILYILLKR